MNLRELMAAYSNESLGKEYIAARVCQDIVLKAVSMSPLSHNVTIKGGVVMRNITKNSRRATKDIDLDFIHYSIDDNAIHTFIKYLNCIEGVTIVILGKIEELKHQDYNGKSIKVRITDSYGNFLDSKIDIGVHKHLELYQEMYCFDVCMDDNGVCLFKNSVEQVFVEKLRALLIFGVYCKRYKDVYDMYFLKDVVNVNKLLDCMKLLIFDDDLMREKQMCDVICRVENTFNDEKYLKRVSLSN